MRNEIYNREWNWMQQLSAALHVFSAIFGGVLKVMVVIFLPICLLESVIVGRMNAVSVALEAFTQVTNMTEVHAEEMLGLMTQLLTNEMLLYAVTLFLHPVGVIAIAKMAKQYIDGEKIQAGKAMGEALNKMPAILLTGVVFGVLVVLGSFVIVPGIYFGIAWGLYQYCIAFEDKSGWEALRSSKKLVNGKWLKTFGYMFLLALIAMLWNSVFSVTCSFLGDSTAANLLYDFLCYVSVGFVAVGETLLYLNRKAMAEGTHVFESSFINNDTDFADMPAEPVEGTVEGVTEEEPKETELLEEKKDEKENI